MIKESEKCVNNAYKFLYFVGYLIESDRHGHATADSTAERRKSKARVAKSINGGKL